MGTTGFDYAIIRTLDAPVDKVWAAWVNADNYAQWASAEQVVLDVRPGGAWSSVMVIPGGARIPLSGSYVEVVPNKRLVMGMNVPGREEPVLMTLDLVADGKIDSLDTPISDYLPELEGGGYDGVSIRHVMQMRSGVDYEERYDFGNPGIAARNHEQALVTNVVRFADVARTIERAHPPGEIWQYKTIDTAVLGWLIERVTGNTLAAYAARRLWEPLGTERDGFFIMDGEPGAGREFSGAGFNATLRDFARIGLMMLGEGTANGRQIIPADWVRDSTRAAGGPGPGYGYQWWIAPDAKSYQAIGLQGQFIYVHPDTRTVIVKLSYFPPEDQAADAETEAFFSAASRWQAR